MNNKKLTIIGILLLVLSAGSALTAAAQVTTNQAALKTIRFVEPKVTTKWTLGTQALVHFEAVNVTSPGYWVKLLKGEQVLGNLAYVITGPGPDSGIIKVSFTCGKLLQGLTYGAGNNYRVEVSTEDGSFKKRSNYFSVVALPIPK